MKGIIAHLSKVGVCDPITEGSRRVCKEWGFIISYGK